MTSKLSNLLTEEGVLHNGFEINSCNSSEMDFESTRSLYEMRFDHWRQVHGMQIEEIAKIKHNFEVYKEERILVSILKRKEGSLLVFTNIAQDILVGYVTLPLGNADTRASL